MNKKIVVDTGALTLFFLGDLRVKPFFNTIADDRADGYVCSVNLAEYWYKTCRKLGRDTAQLRYHQASTILHVVETDTSLSQAAGQEKCKNDLLSLADSFALALTRSLDAHLLTTDSVLGKVKGIDVKFFDIL